MKLLYLLQQMSFYTSLVRAAPWSTCETGWLEGLKDTCKKTLPKLHSLDHTLYRGFAHLQKLKTGGSTVSLSDSRVSGLFGVSPNTLPARILYWRPCQPAVREPWTEKSACYGETALPFRCVEVCFI